MLKLVVGKALALLHLLTPVLFPSWRFFSSIGPSPRIDFLLLVDEGGEATNTQAAVPQYEWQEFFTLPARLTVTQQIQRLFYSPCWNEQLYINTCAEQLMESADDFREREIGLRILNARKDQRGLPSAKGIKFRIRALSIEQGVMREELVFSSREFLFESSFDPISTPGAKHAN